MHTLENRASLDADALAELEAAVASHHTLEDVVRWGLAHCPPRMIADVVVQDEFTHDVVVPCGGERFLVYDAT
jgi:hypothetical protein